MEKVSVCVSMYWVYWVVCRVDVEWFKKGKITFDWPRRQVYIQETSSCTNACNLPRTGQVKTGKQLELNMIGFESTLGYVPRGRYYITGITGSRPRHARLTLRFRVCLVSSCTHMHAKVRTVQYLGSSGIRNKSQQQPYQTIELIAVYSKSPA